MPNTYGWKIATQKVASMTVGGETLENVITHLVEVRCVVSDGTNANEAVYSSKCPIALDPPVPADFIPEDELTYETVTGWAMTRLGDTEIANLKAAADQALAAQLAPAPIAGPTFEPPAVA